MGEGADVASARRRLEVDEERRMYKCKCTLERRMDREQRAHHLRLMLDRAILRRGDFYIL